MHFKKFIRFYNFAGISLLNFLTLLVVVNFCLFIIFSIRDLFRKDPVQEKYDNIDFAKYYPDMDKSELDLLFTETWTRGLSYEGFTQFTESEYNGTFVNIDADGYRKSADQAVLSKGKQANNIFIIGGSTTFGYGVKDDDTIASKLQTQLRNNINKEINIFNFGRSFYYSSQERVLIQNLIHKGYLPSLVIFIDGLNEFIHIQDEPIYSYEIRKSFQKRKNVKENQYFSLLNETSTGRALNFLKMKIGYGNTENEQIIKQINSESIYLRYIENKRMIKSILTTYSIESLFVWQPIPSYKYDQKFHPFAKHGYNIHQHSEKGYAEFHSYLKDNSLGDDFLWLADIQLDEKKPLYVDLVHYSPYMNGKLASKISGHPILNYLFN